MKEHVLKCLATVPGLFFLVAGLVCMGQVSGCGDDEKEQIIELMPESLDIDGANNLFLVDGLFVSIVKAPPTGGEAAQLFAPPQGGFLPWGLSTDAGFAHDVLFVTDIRKGDLQRLLSLNTRFQLNSINDPGMILASTSGPGDQDHFTQLRAVAAYTPEAGGSTVRVFVADADPQGIGERVVVFDYDTGAQTPTFTLRSIITSPGAGPCPDPFQEPYGLAVDPDNDFLYVADHEGGRLYQFNGIDGNSPTCAGEVIDAGGQGLSEPQGVTVLSGQAPQANQVLVADSGNRRIASFKWEGASLAFYKQTSAVDRPFDLAIDRDGNLWISYPTIRRIDALPAGSFE